MPIPMAKLSNWVLFYFQFTTIDTKQYIFKVLIIWLFIDVPPVVSLSTKLIKHIRNMHRLQNPIKAINQLLPNQDLSVLYGGPTLNYGEQLSEFSPYVPRK